MPGFLLASLLPGSLQAGSPSYPNAAALYTCTLSQCISIFMHGKLLHFADSTYVKDFFNYNVRLSIDFPSQKSTEQDKVVRDARESKRKMTCKNSTNAYFF